MKQKQQQDAEEFVLTWSFAFKPKGLPTETISIESHDCSEALIAFHAEMQLRRGKSRDDYAIDKITSNHTPPQHYDRFDLPPRNPDVRQCTFTKRLARKFEAEFKAAGIEVRLA